MSPRPVTALARRIRRAPPGSSDPRADRATIERLMESYWAGRSPHTLAAYRGDIEQFCDYLTRACGLERNLPQLEKLRVFFGSGAGRANELVLNYRSEMRNQDRAPNTINRRLAAVRALVKLGRLIGAVPWSIEVEGVPHELTRDTRGPSPEIVSALIAAAAAAQEKPMIAARDVAMLRITFDLGLRVGEVVRLDMADLALDTVPATVWVLGKGRVRKQLLKLPAPTVTALRAWLLARGKTAGPLFTSYSPRPANRERRLVTRGAYRIMRDLGAQLGIHLHPHMLRHSAITQAVEKSVDLRLSLDQVRDFSRHKNVQTLMTYRDRAADKQADLAKAVAETAPTKKSDDEPTE